MLRRSAAMVVRHPLPAALGLAVYALMTWWMVEFYVTMPEDQRLIDLEVYRDAGTSVLTGRPVYDWLTASPQLLPFTYPPIAAIFAMPLALIPPSLLGWLWTAMQMLLLLGIVALAYRPLLERFGRWSLLATGALAGLVLWELPLRDGIRFGQVDIIIVALCAADYLVRNPRWPRGLLVGVATAVKLTPGVFIIHLWLAGRRREAVTAITTAVGLVGLGFLVIPADSADFWFNAIIDPDRLGSNAGTSNQSLRGMLIRFGLDSGLVWLPLAALVGWYGFRVAVRASRRGDNLIACAVVGLLAVLLSPVAWIHHLAWVVLALAAIVGDGRNVRRNSLAGFVWIFFYLKIPWWGQALVNTDIPVILARIVQDGYGLMAVALLFVLNRLVRASGGSGGEPPPVGALTSPPSVARLPGQGAPNRLHGGKDGEQREQPAGQPSNRS